MNRKKSILLIDDDDDELEIFIIALNDSGVEYNCNFARSAEQALMIVKGLVPDFIFLDINMPKTNGFKCLQEIKKIKDLKDTPVIIYFVADSEADARALVFTFLMKARKHLKYFFCLFLVKAVAIIFYRDNVICFVSFGRSIIDFGTLFFCIFDMKQRRFIFFSKFNGVLY